MAMDTIFATLVLYLLALSPKIKTTESLSVTTPAHKTETVTQFNATVHTTVTLNLTEDTTPFNSTNSNKTTLTTDRTRPLQTSQSTTIMATLSKSASPTATTPSTHTPTSTAHTNSAMHTTGFISASATTVILTNSSHTVNTSFHSLDSTTQQALRLNTSERIITTSFSVILGVLAMTLFAFTFHKCKQKTQYLHQPLNNSDTDAFLANDDTLIISGGLYGGHPIYDNVPSASAPHSQFSLEFLY